MRDERTRVAANWPTAITGALALTLLAVVPQQAAAGGDPFVTIPQDDCSRAELIRPDQPMAGSVEGRTLRYFRFVLRSGGTYRLFTTGSADTYGQLLDANCHVIVGDDDGGQGSNFLIERTLRPGTYYISVRGRRNSSTGRYVLTLEERDDESSDVSRDESSDDSREDSSDDCRGASTLTVGGSVSGNVQGREKQYYRFRLSNAGICRIFTRGATDTVGELLDVRCVRIDRDNDSGGQSNFRIERNLQPGTYYIAVRGEDLHTSGRYTLHLEYEAACSGAQSLSVGVPVSGRTEGQTRQYFRFRVTTSGEYRVYTSGSTDTVGQLLDDACNIVERNDDDGEGANFLFERELRPGTYFVSVRGFDDSTSGRFTLHVEAVPNCSTAQTLSVGGSVSGSIQGTALQFYRFQVSLAKTYRIYTSGSVNTVGQLLDDDCDEIDSNNDGGEDSNFLFERELRPGTYFVSVRGYNDSTSGRFTLHVEAVPDCSDAQPLALGESVSGYAHGTALQYYRFQVSLTNTYRIYTSGSVDTVGQLLDDDCDEIDSDDDDGEGSNFLFERELRPATYFVSVRGFNDNASGRFTLTVEVEQDCSYAQPLALGESVSGGAQGTAMRYYRFRVSEAGTYRIYTLGSVDTVGQLLDEDCDEIDSDDDGGEGANFLFERELWPATYFVSVRGFNEHTSGLYTVHVERIGDGCSSAYDIPDSGYILGAVRGEERTFYRLRIYTSGTYSIYTTGDVDTVGELLDSNCYLITEDDDGGGIYGYNFLIERALRPGTYYVSVRGFASSAYGDFTLIVKQD